MNNRASGTKFNIATMVANSGFAVIAVGAGECNSPGCCGGHVTQPWAYTVGLAEIRHPEVVVLGLDSESAHGGLSMVANRALEGNPMMVGFPESHGHQRSKLLDVPVDWLATDPSRMAVWFDHYSTGPLSEIAPDVRQLVWSDDAGQFPDEDAFDPRLRHLQPLLDADWRSYPAPRVPHRNPARVGRHRR